MKAAVLEDVKKLVVKDIPTPVPVDDMALVRVKACGICMTDYKAYSGERKNVTFPAICGHEFSGIIEKAGDKVKFFKPGDEIIASPVSNCGMCNDCRRGLAQYCKNGAVIGGDGMDTIIDGAFAEYVLVPENSLYHKPKDISFDAAALTEPLAGSYKGLIEYSQLQISEDLVIIGAGSMGLLASMIAERAGAASIIMIDINDWRLEYSKKCGATHLINSTKVDPIKAVHDILPDGPDIVFEAAGPIPAAQLAFDLCRRGTRVNEFGVTTEGTINVSPAQIHWKETRVDASFSVYPRAMQRSIRLMEKGFVDSSKIITHNFKLDDIKEAMDTMKKPDRVKVVINP
ncbi:MAG: zinc-binding dehydrogenase [Candidatus Hodarchaeota archaeon]